MRMMQVLPNPYRVLDADGNPTAVVPCHPRHAPGEFVGATKKLNVLEPAQFVDIKRTVGGKQVVEQKLAQYDRSKATFTFSSEPTTVPAEGAVGVYYRDRVREGSLVAADRSTAQKCGVVFEDPAVVIAKERDQAAREYERQFKELPPWANNTNPAPISAPN
jgi:hypothetical protein